MVVCSVERGPLLIFQSLLILNQVFVTLGTIDALFLDSMFSLFVFVFVIVSFEYETEHWERAFSHEMLQLFSISF